MPGKHLLSSLEVCLFGFMSGDMEGQGRISGIVVGEKLRGVACCMGSGTVVLQYNAMQRLMHQIKQQNM